MEKLFAKLSSYYQSAVLNNFNSVPDMKKAILASFYHKCSTDEKSQHQYCPISTTEKESWCPYWRAEAKGILKDYKHPPAFDEETQEVLKSIYEDLTSDELLERCLGATRKTTMRAIIHAFGTLFLNTSLLLNKFLKLLLTLPLVFSMKASFQF